MKNPKLFLTSTLKSILILALVISAYSSCSSDDDGDDSPIENFTALPNNLLTSYTDGVLNYTGADGTNIINAVTGIATISGTSSNYTITFSDNVPSLTGIRFALIDDTYQSVTINGNTNAQNIVLDDDTLVVGATLNGDNWVFSND